MHVIESQEDLFCDLLDEMGRDAFALVALDEPEQVLAEDLEDHADVGAVGAFVAKVVEKGDDMGSAGVCLRGRCWRMRVFWRGLDGRRGGRDQPLEELDLVQRRLGVPWRGLYDLQRDVPVQPALAMSTTDIKSNQIYSL